VQGQAAVHAHLDSFAGAEPPADEHLRVQPGYRRLDLAPDDQQHPHGVLAGGDGGGGLGLRDVGLVDHHHESQRQTTGDGAAGAPFGGESGYDRGTGGVPQSRHN
jgi:hypothetical protein